MSDDNLSYLLGKHFWKHKNDKPRYAASLEEITIALRSSIDTSRYAIGAELSRLKNKKRILDRRKPEKDEGNTERYFLRPDVKEVDIEALKGNKITLGRYEKSCIKL